MSKHYARLIGVNVNLELGGGANAELAVAHSSEELERSLRVEGFGINQELVAITILGTFPVVNLLDLNLRGHVSASESQLVTERTLLAGKGRDEGIEKNGKTVTARIDYAILFEDGEEFGGALNGSVSLGDDGVEGLLGTEALLASIGCGSCAVTQNGEDGALDRLADSLEGNLDGLLKSVCNVMRVELICSNAALAQTAKDLGGDNAGITASAHECARGDCLANGCAVSADGKLRDVVDDALDRQGHVGAGITIRNREHIQTVYFLFALGKRFACRRDGVQDVIGSVSCHDESISP